MMILSTLSCGTFFQAPLRKRTSKIFFDLKGALLVFVFLSPWLAFWFAFEHSNNPMLTPFAKRCQIFDNHTRLTQVQRRTRDG